MAAVNPEAWVDHFKQTVGKPYMWGADPALVTLKNKSGTPHTTTQKEVPLTVVSPVEQYDEMAKAVIDKGTPKYQAPSVAHKASKGKGRSKRKRTGNHSTASSSSTAKKARHSTTTSSSSTNRNPHKKARRKRGKRKQGRRKGGKHSPSGGGDIFD